MILAGMNVARLNFSHGNLDGHRKVVIAIRELSKELDTPIAILGDIQGPRIRTQVSSGAEVSEGEELWMGDVDHGVGDLDTLHGKFFLLDQAAVIEVLSPGDAVLIGDGAIQLKVLEVTNGFARVRALNPGIIENHKGVNLPDTPLRIPVITSKDEQDLAFAVAEGLDYVGLSFVGSAEDVAEARETMQKTVGENDIIPAIVAKIERKEALKNLKKIIKATDAVMVARGDLGIEMPESEVALLQKRIIAESLRQRRPVIVATQMLKSMVENPRPTRAEVSDVTNAVIDHTDAIMLSEESAMGKYPVEAIAMMREIADKTEESPFDDMYQELSGNMRSEFAVIVRSVYQLARSYEAHGIVLVTRSGFTARLLSHFRPEGRLFVGTWEKSVWQRLALVWGVDAFLFDGHTGTDEAVSRVIDRAKERQLLHPGDRIVACLGREVASDTLQLVGVREIV
jgi:pyruvate kinase